MSRIIICRERPDGWGGTSFLQCTHSFNKKSQMRYMMYCDVLKTMPDGRKKVRVYGERYHRSSGSRIRYVEAGRVVDVADFSLPGKEKE